MRVVFSQHAVHSHFYTRHVIVTGILAMRALSSIHLKVALVFFAITASASADTWTLRMDVNGQRREGTAIRWTGGQVQMLYRDGATEVLNRSQARNVKKLSRGFRSYSSATMRDMLMREFGTGWDVSSTDHYLVVHPMGDTASWAPRFEMLYREMMAYFSVRDVDMHEPKFPMVAVIMPNEKMFQKYARSQGINLGPGYLGFYVSDTNRILMYNAGGSSNIETVIHEAAHQTAFNTGIHNRFSPPPRWICEGIGTLFEAPGVYSSSKYRSRRDRINRGQYAAYRHFFPDGPGEEKLARLIADDRYFMSNTDEAYALAWALTFMFTELETGELSNYLKRTSSGAAFTDASQQKMVSDFNSSFGSELAMVSARLHRFMMELP